MLIMVKNSRKGKPGAWQRGEGVGHATSLPGTAWTCIATSGVHMGIIVKLSVTLPCVKSHVSRTSGTILNCTPKVGHKTNYYERV